MTDYYLLFFLFALFLYLVSSEYYSKKERERFAQWNKSIIPGPNLWRNCHIDKCAL